MPAAADAGGGACGRGARGWLGTTAFRLTLLHLVLTLLGTAALSGVAFWAATRFAARQIEAGIQRDVGVLLGAARLGGIASVALSVEARIAADRSGTEHYRVSDAQGRHVAGNLAQAPPVRGWRTLRLKGADGPDAGAAPSEAVLAAFGTALPGGGSLVVARDLAPVRELEARLTGAAGWVGGGALLVGLLGGLVVGRSAARRAAAMDTALAAVEAGDMARRLLARAGGDEFDRLAARINATLDRLQETMAALRRVTDDIAHDLRTPLTRLRQRLEAAQRGALGEADWAAAVEGAIGDCDRILGIFAALLRIAQLEAGARRSAFARFDLSAVVEAVAEVYAPAAEERGQALVARAASGVAARGDRELVTQMLANLVENAIRHAGAGGTVLVELRRAGDGAALVVADDGPGIPAPERERVFRPFHRLDTARSSPGAGLGLPLVKAIAGLHGMEVALSDNAPGLRVTVSIPAAPA